MSVPKKLYMVGQTHFDVVWLWRWDESMASIRATFHSALERMKENADFCYSFCTPPVFEWIKHTEPALFEEIRERVKEGRWEIAEGWWVQPDCYSASGESYVRQGLYGQKWLRENFGKTSRGMLNLDCFGQNPQLPQILRKSGMEFYAFIRPEARHIQLPQSLFWWQGLDGTRITAYRASGAYAKTIAEAIGEQSDSMEDAMIVFGVTDHGGAPTKQLISEIEQTENARFSTAAAFFEDHPQIESVVSNELLTGDFGPYADHPSIKKRNRMAEYALLNAEVASVIAGEYDSAALEQCWHDLLFNQFHDILGGASIKDAYMDAEHMLGRAIWTANEIMHYRLQSITKNIKTVGHNPRDIWNLAIWNLNGEAYDGYLEAEVQWAHEFDWYDRGIELQDENGKIYPCQVIQAKSVIPRFRSRFVFKCDIPSAGYRMLRVVQTDMEEQKQEIDPFFFETAVVAVRFSRESGALELVSDRQSGDVIAQNVLTPVCYFDDGDTWGFNIEGYDTEKKTFVFDSLRVIESGTLRTVIKATHRFGDSKLELYYTFYENETYFDVSYRVHWSDKHYVLKLETPVESNAHIVSVPYGSVARGETRRDVPMGAWIKCGKLSFVTDCIFAYNMMDRTLGLTVLRSAIYGDFRLGELDYDEDYDILSQGIEEGKIRIDPNGDGYQGVAGYLNPPIIVCESNHDGNLPYQNSYYAVEGEGVMLSAVKACEYDEGIVFRLFESRGRKTEAVLRAGGLRKALQFDAFEIKTLKLHDGILQEIMMTEV